MKTILVIDDNETFRVILAEWLQAEGFYPITAKDGLEGIRLAQSQHPDLILCDVNMPAMNGLEVLKQLRNNPKTLQIPFFFLTAETRLASRTAQQSGAVGVLSKQAEIDKLRKALTILKV